MGGTAHLPLGCSDILYPGRVTKVGEHEGRGGVVTGAYGGAEKDVCRFDVSVDDGAEVRGRACRGPVTEVQEGESVAHLQK